MLSILASFWMIGNIAVAGEKFHVYIPAFFLSTSDSQPELHVRVPLVVSQRK